MGILALLVLGFFFVKQDFSKATDTLYLNGKIITMDNQQAVAQAMLVSKGIIKEIGTEEALAKFNNGKIKTIDLEGAIILPGFIDVHTHAALSALLETMIDLSGFKHQTNHEVWNHLGKEAQKKAAGEWIIGKGIDPILIPDLKVPDRKFLDSIAADKPMVLFAQSLHSYWLNSIALETIGITKATPDPSKESYYAKDENGELTGLIVEQAAFLPVFTYLKKEVFKLPVLVNAIHQTLKNYAANGNTTIVSTGLTIEDQNGLRLFQHLSDEKSGFVNQLLAKLSLFPQRSPLPRHFIYLRHDTPQLMPAHPGPENDFYDIIGIKHWYDGSPYIGSMYLSAPYDSSKLTREDLHIPEGHKGKALITKDSLVQFIKSYHTKGWQIAIHTQGDAAIQEVVEAFEIANQDTDFSKSRHRLEHCLLLPETSIPKMKALNLTPSFHINHLYYYGEALNESILGNERTESILPIAKTMDSKIKFTLHADQPMFDSRPFRLIQTAVERKTRSGQEIGNEQKITVQQAIKALTIDAAWQINKEDKLGSLAKGKYADFILLDKNPFECPVVELENIKIVKTYINGNEVQ